MQKKHKQKNIKNDNIAKNTENEHVIKNGIIMSSDIESLRDETGK